MNRIQLGPLATTSESREKGSRMAAAKVQLLEQLRLQRRTGAAIFAPLHYEASYSYPLIVWLHSNGDDQSQIQRVMPSISLRNYVAVAPQAESGNSSAGYFWEQTPTGIDRAQELVAEAIDFARMKLNVASHRVYLAGYGAGGTMALRVGLHLAQGLAGVISINGPLPIGFTPLRDWMNCRMLPIFWAHCRRSKEFIESEMCAQLKLLHVAGFNVTLRQYPNEDELPAQSLADLNRWIMESIPTAIR